MSDFYKMRATMNDIFDTLEDHAQQLADQRKQIQDQNQRIIALEKSNFTCTRNLKIINAIRKGEKTKEVAKQFGLSSSRVAQIAPRKFN